MEFSKYVNELPYSSFKKDKEAYRAYYEREEQIFDLFWSDAFEYCGVSEGHPKSELAKSLAWSYGHSNGFSSVFEYFCDLSEFLD